MEPEFEELMSHLKRVESASGALRDLHEEWRAIASAAGHSCATDATGSVRVSMDADGVPESIVLAPDWRRLVGTERLADAVTEACQNAVFAGLEALGKATPAHSDWGRRSEEVMAYLDGAGPAPAWMPLNSPQTAGPPSGMPTAADIDDLAAHLTNGEWTATAAQGRLGLTVDIAGVVTCRADPDWASRHDTQQINDCLAVALASARNQRPMWNW